MVSAASFVPGPGPNGDVVLYVTKGSVGVAARAPSWSTFALSTLSATSLKSAVLSGGALSLISAGGLQYAVTF